LWVAPVLPAAFTPLRIEGVALGEDRVSLQVSPEDTVLEGLTAGVEVRREPHSPDGGR
jgi:hypothetical protein